MKISVAFVLMIILIMGITLINYHLGVVLDINSQSEFITILWFLYCCVSGGLVGWFGSKYLFTQFFRK